MIYMTQLAQLTMMTWLHEAMIDLLTQQLLQATKSSPSSAQIISRKVSSFVLASLSLLASYKETLCIMIGRFSTIYPSSWSRIYNVNYICITCSKFILQISCIINRSKIDTRHAAKSHLQRSAPPAHDISGHSLPLEL